MKDEQPVLFVFQKFDLSDSLSLSIGIMSTEEKSRVFSQTYTKEEYDPAQIMQEHASLFPKHFRNYKTIYRGSFSNDEKESFRQGIDSVLAQYEQTQNEQKSSHLKSVCDEER